MAFLLFGVGLGGFMVWQHMLPKLESNRDATITDIRKFSQETQAQLSALDTRLKEKDLELATMSSRHNAQLKSYEVQISSLKKDAANREQQTVDLKPAASTVSQEQNLRLVFETVGLRRGEFSQKLKNCRDELSANSSLSHQARGQLKELANVVHALSEFSRKPDQNLKLLNEFLIRGQCADEKILKDKPSPFLRVAAIFSKGARQKLRDYRMAAAHQEALAEVEFVLRIQMRQLASQIQPVSFELDRSLRTVEVMLDGRFVYRDDKAREFLATAETISKMIDRQFAANNPRS